MVLKSRQKKSHGGLYDTLRSFALTTIWYDKPNRHRPRRRCRSHRFKVVKKRKAKVMRG